MFDAQNANAQNNNTVDKVPIRFINPFPASQSKLAGLPFVKLDTEWRRGVGSRWKFPAKELLQDDSQETDRSARNAGQAGRFVRSGFCQGRRGRCDSGRSRSRTRSYIYDSLTVPRPSL